MDKLLIKIVFSKDFKKYTYEYNLNVEQMKTYLPLFLLNLSLNGFGGIPFENTGINGVDYNSYYTDSLRFKQPGRYYGCIFGENNDKYVVAYWEGLDEQDTTPKFKFNGFESCEIDFYDGESAQGYYRTFAWKEYIEFISKEFEPQ